MTSRNMPPADTFDNGVLVKGTSILQVVKLDGVDITFASAVVPDFRKSSLQRLTLTGTCAIGNPLGAKLGTEIILEITQDGTGGRHVTWGSDYDFGDAGSPPFTDDAADTVTVVRGIVVEDQGRIVCLAIRGEGAAASNTNLGDTAIDALTATSIDTGSLASDTSDLGVVTVTSLNGWTFLSGTAVPSAGGGVAATAPAVYGRNNAGTWTYYGKTGALATDWTQFDPID